MLPALVGTSLISPDSLQLIFALFYSFFTSKELRNFSEYLFRNSISLFVLNIHQLLSFQITVTFISCSITKLWYLDDKVPLVRFPGCERGATTVVLAGLSLPTDRSYNNPPPLAPIASDSE